MTADSDARQRRDVTGRDADVRRNEIVTLSIGARDETKRFKDEIEIN